MAYALDGARQASAAVNADAAPEHYFEFPGVDRIEIAAETTTDADAVIVMECSDLTRTGVAGLDGRFIINIDHHAGNRDVRGDQLVRRVGGGVRRDGVRHHQGARRAADEEIATHIYLAILTDTGAFHHSNITPRTFEICRQTVEAGVNPAIMARRVYDSNSFGKLKLIGALLDQMELVDDGRLAVLRMDDAMLDGVRLHATTTPKGSSTCRSPRGRSRQWCSSGRRATAACGSACGRSTTSTCGVVANEFGGGGHKNAAGFTVAGPLADVQARIVERLVARRRRGPADPPD